MKHDQHGVRVHARSTETLFIVDEVPTSQNYSKFIIKEKKNSYVDL